MTKVGVILLAILSLFAVSANPGHQADRKSREAPKPPEEQVAGSVGNMPDPLAAVEAAVQEYLAVRYYLDVVFPGQQAVEAYLYALAHPPPRPVSVARSGNCCGPHSDAWWRGVAQCEQSGNNHPYFGYFSWMDGSAAGMTWDEQVAKSNALLSRVSSESPAWAASCVAMGYQYSPSG